MHTNGRTSAQMGTFPVIIARQRASCTAAAAHRLTFSIFGDAKWRWSGYSPSVCCYRWLCDYVRTIAYAGSGCIRYAVERSLWVHADCWRLSESAAGADATQWLPLWEWNLSYLEKRRVRPVPHRVRPQRAGLPLRRNNRENDRHYTRQGLHPNQLSHYKRRVEDFEWQWRSERSQTRDRTLLANLPQRSRQPLHGRWDPG